MTVEEWHDALAAVEEGRATEVWPCPQCDGEPLRGVVGRKVVGRADPTEVMQLNCGHRTV